jgi:hypothetical protein
MCRCQMRTAAVKKQATRRRGVKRPLAQLERVPEGNSDVALPADPLGRKFGRRTEPWFRHILAETVHAYLPVGSEDRALADACVAWQIDWRKYRSRAQRSPIAAADKELCKRYPLLWAPRHENSRHELLRTWFVTLRSIQPDAREDAAKDERRMPVVGAELADEQWERLEHALVCARYSEAYTDGQRRLHRRRRFTGLSHYRDHQAEQAAKHTPGAQEKLADIADLFEKSKARTWAALDAAVTEKFDLVWEREKFHELREEQKHQVHAQRAVGDAPVLEYHRSNKKDPRLAPEEQNGRYVVTVQLRNPRYNGTPAIKLPPPQASKAAQAAWGDPRNAEYKQQMDKNHQLKYMRPVPLLYDLSMLQITMQGDGFTKWTHIDQKKHNSKPEGNLVARRRNELLETVACAKARASYNKEKHYYMALSMAGYGIIRIALMHSGSEVSEGSIVPFWTSQIAELGLGGEYATTYTQRKALELKLQNNSWKVCPLTIPVTALWQLHVGTNKLLAVRCCNPHSRHRLAPPRALSACAPGAALLPDLCAC